MVNLREIVDGVFQGDVISKMSQGSALKSLAYKTVRLTYKEIIPPLDEQEAYFITEQFMGGWLSPLLDNINRQPEEKKDKKKIRENTDFDKEDGIPDKIGELDVLKISKAIGQSHISEVVAGTPLTPEKRETLMSIKKKFADNGKSLTSTLGEVVDSPEPREIRRQRKTGDFDEMGLALDDAVREREEENRPTIEFNPRAFRTSRREAAQRDATDRDSFGKSEWFNVLKRDD